MRAENLLTFFTACFISSEDEGEDHAESSILTIAWGNMLNFLFKCK